MKWLRNRFLLLPYVVLLATLIVVGCTSKQDPSEVLAVCGNHSCGELVMVTTDTASDGFHYLNPSLSPDGTRILFTADWWAIPADPRYTGDDLFVNNRQILTIPAQVGVQPASSLLSQGGQLTVFQERTVQFGGADARLRGDILINDDKSKAIWQDDNHIIFSLLPTELGGRYRMMRADITNQALAPLEFLYMEPADAFPSPPFWQHLEPSLSPDQRWLAFTRSGCVIPDSFETCTGAAIWVIDMATAGVNDGYSTRAFPVTDEFSRVENPNWSPDGTRIIFAGGVDVAGAGSGEGTEIFTVAFDTTGLAAGAMPLQRGLKRLTHTKRTAGDPIAGIVNNSPVYSLDGRTVYFVSSRRAPAITLHDRNIWRVPADGSVEPEIYFFSRSDDVDPSVLPDGRILMSSAMGFPTEMLVRLEEESYQRIAAQDTLGLDEVQLRKKANDERRQLEFFAGVMSHLYIYRP